VVHELLPTLPPDDALARWHEPLRGRGREPHGSRGHGADPQLVLAERAIDLIIDLDLCCCRGGGAAPPMSPLQSQGRCCCCCC
jgi:hypothetical protein